MSLEYNFEDNNSLNFYGFLNYIHESIIREMLAINTKLDNKILDPETIKDVLL